MWKWKEETIIEGTTYSYKLLGGTFKVWECASTGDINSWYADMKDKCFPIYSGKCLEEALKECEVWFNKQTGGRIVA